MACRRHERQCRPGIPAAINGHGWVVGSDVDHGFVWHDGIRVDLGFGTAARAVDDRNEVVGTHGGRAFVWRNGVMTDLPTLGREASVPVAINDHGLVVGYTHTGPYDPDHAVLWRDGRIRDLGSFGGARVKQAVDVNERGEILVQSSFPDQHAWLWRSGKARDLGTLGHPWWNVARDLNDAGVVVGNVLRAPHGPSVPYVWRNGKFTVLPALDGYGPPVTSATDISDAGVVVGSSYRNDGSHAVVWR